MKRFEVAYLASLLVATAVAFTVLALVLYRWLAWPEAPIPGDTGATGSTGPQGATGAVGPTGATGTVLTLVAATAQFDTGGAQFNPNTYFYFRKYNNEDVIVEFDGVGNVPIGVSMAFNVLDNIPAGFAPASSHTGRCWADDRPWWAYTLKITPTHIEMPYDYYTFAAGMKVIGCIRYPLT